MALRVDRGLAPAHGRDERDLISFSKLHIAIDIRLIDRHHQTRREVCKSRSFRCEGNDQVRHSRARGQRHFSITGPHQIAARREKKHGYGHVLLPFDYCAECEDTPGGHLYQLIHYRDALLFHRPSEEPSPTVPSQKPSPKAIAHSAQVRLATHFCFAIHLAGQRMSFSYKSDLRCA